MALAISAILLKKELQMETDRVGGLLFRLSVPQVAVNLINVIVGFFTGVIIAGMDIQYLAAYTIASPLCVSVTFALLCGVRLGTASLIARSFGEREKIHSIIHTGAWLTLAHLVVSLVLCGCAARWFMGLFSTDPALIDIGTKYIWLMLVSTIFSAFGFYFIQVLQALGEMVLTSAFSLFSIPATLVLNVVLIYGRLGAPRMGLYGAAVTSILIGALQFAYALYLLYRKGFLGFFRYRPDMHKTGQIMHIALPAMLQQLLATILVAGFNKLISTFSEVYVVVMGIFYKWNSINQNMILSSSLMPVIGYNASKGRTDRLLRTIRQALAYTLVIAVVPTAVYIGFAGPCLKIFNCPAEILDSSILIFQLLNLYVIPMSVVTLLSNASIALGNGSIGMFALVAQTVLTLGGGLALRPLGELYSVLAFAGAEWITLIAVLVILSQSKKESNALLHKALWMKRAII